MKARASAWNNIFNISGRCILNSLFAFILQVHVFIQFIVIGNIFILALSIVLNVNPPCHLYSYVFLF